MKPLDLRITDPVEALVVERALALVRQLKQTCQQAPDGHVLAQAELAARAGGRELTRRALEAVLNHQPCPAENKGRRPAPARAAKGGRARGKRRATP